MRHRVFPAFPDTPVSVLGFGCMRLPVLDRDAARIDDEAATSLLRRAVDGGVSYVDTAYPYHDGTSEPFVGRALKGGYREKVMLATKHPVWLATTEADWERYLDEQLARLDTSFVDIYLLHALSAERWDTVCRLHALRALERARADGRIRHLGFSFHGSPDSFATILAAYDWELVQVQYNFLDEEFQAGTAGVRQAAARGIGVVAMEPLRGGALAGRVPEDVQAIWARHSPGRSPARWALRWVWDHPEVVTALSGMETQAQLDENLLAADEAAPAVMSASELALVAEVRDSYRSRTKVECTSCGYCIPCPSGVAIPDVFALYNTAAMFGSRRSVAGWYRSAYASVGHGGDACVACGECLSRCPQSIEIIGKLREAHEHLVS